MEEFKNNKKFQDTVNTAKRLFWKHGIKRVSIEEICKETPVSKMTFYKFFKNKEFLAKYVLEELLTQGHLEYRTEMDSDKPFTEKIKQLIELKKKFSENISEELLKDIYNNDFIELQKLMSDHQKNYYKEVVNDLVSAQKKGEIRQGVKPEFILYTLEDISRKANDEQLFSMYSSKQEMIMELTNYFFYGIMNEKE